MRHSNVVPICLFGVVVAAEIAAVSLALGVQRTDVTVLYAVYSTALVGAGALILRRHPRHPIGWLFCGFAILNAVTADLAQGYALRAAHEGWPGGSAAEAVNTMSWLPSGFGWILTFLLFPDGRLLGRRWSIVAWIAAAGMALALPGWALSPDRAPDYASGRNPLAVDALPTDALLAVGMVLFLGAMVASAVSLILRFHRSRGLERLQLKWFAFAAVAAAVILPLSFALWYVTPVAHVAAALALTALPIAACVAILRYRLYDIDVVINRTLVYGGLTVLLAGAYTATALLLGTLLGRGSTWATAGATLVAAAAFRPLRARVQNAVDRRFNRARYDAMGRMVAFLDAIHAGRATHEEVVEVLRQVMADPELDILFQLPDATFVDVMGAPRDPTTNQREQIAINRAGQPLGVVLHTLADERQLRLLRRLIETGGLAIEIARLRIELRRQLAEVEASRARGATAHRTRSPRRRSAAPCLGRPDASPCPARTPKHLTATCIRHHRRGRYGANRCDRATPRARPWSAALSARQWTRTSVPRACSADTDAGQRDRLGRAIRRRRRSCRLLHWMRRRHERRQTRARHQNRAHRGADERQARCLGCRRRCRGCHSDPRYRARQPERPRRCARRHTSRPQ